MDKIIEKYNYMSGTTQAAEAIETEFQEKCEDIGEKIKPDSMKKSFAALTKKICVTGFPACHSPGYEMADVTIKFICVVMDEGLSNDALQREDCQKLVYDMLIDCLVSGQGSSHCTLMKDLLSMAPVEMDEYIQGLRGPQMLRLTSCLKSLNYSPESGISVEEHAECWKRCVTEILSWLRGDSEKFQEPEVCTEMVDLYFFYLFKMSEMPEPFHDEMKRCMRDLDDDEDMSKFFTAKHLSTIEKAIHQESFPKSETHHDQTKNVITDIMLSTHSERFNEELWDALNVFLKNLVLSKHVNKFKKIIEEFRYLYSKMEDDTLKKHPKLIHKWSPIFTEIIEKGETKVVELFAEEAVDTMQSNCVPAKGDAVVWFPLLKALLKHVQKRLISLADSILDETKFKKIWEWKKNWTEGQAIIQQISKVENLPKDEGTGGYWDNRNIMSAYGNVVRHILDQFGIVKIAENVALDIAELYISMMEKGSDIINYMLSSLTGEKPSLKKHKDEIPKLVKRFEVLFLDPDYPWTNSDTDSAGESFVTWILESYKSGAEVPEEVNKSLINIFRHCLEGDVELVEMEHGNPTVFSTLIWGPLYKFINMHSNSQSSKVLEILMPLIIKMMDIEDGPPELSEMAQAMFLSISQMQTDVLKNSFGDIIGLYVKNKAVMLLTTLFMMYKNLESDSMGDRFQDLFNACKEDPENVNMHIAIFGEAAKKIPEAFTVEIVTYMMTTHLQNMNLRTMALMTLDTVATECPDRIPVDVFMQKIFKDIKFDDNCANYITKLSISVGRLHESYADQIINNLFELSKKCKDPMYIVVFISGMRSIAETYGVEKLKPYRGYFEDMKQNGKSSEMKTAASNALDALEGRSLTTVMDEVKEQKKDIKVLDKKVTDTRKTVAVVKTQVKKQEIAITNVKKDVKDVNKRVDVVETDLEETKVKVEEIDNKTMTNAPAWSRDVTKLMNPKAEHDWRLLASRLGYSNKDIKGWATQHDPCMAVLSEWYATHKTVEATHGVLTALQEMNRMDAAAIVENAMKNVEGIVEEAPDYATPPPIFLSYQWGHQNEVKLLRNHLQMAGYECWMDIGQMGGGDKLFEKIDNGIRGAKLIICCVSEKYAKSPNCNREVNLSVNLGKPMIPLLMEKMGWPPKGSMGPIFSEYLFVRFFQRAGEETKDDRYWPVPKFQELLMQINLEVPPDNALVTKEYKEWWKPMAEEIIIIKKVDKGQGSQPQKTSGAEKEEDQSPDVFISYQWGKQPQIKQLYRRLTELGFSCWMDIYQMGGGDSLYDKIDRGVRGCKIILSCVTTKYSLSANCRREVSLADAIKKPIIPLLLEKIDWPPTGPMSMVFAQLLFINFYRDEAVQMSWKGEKFDELLGKIKENVPEICFDDKSVDDTKTQPKEEESKTKKTVTKESQQTKANQEQTRRQENNSKLNKTQKPEDKSLKPKATQKPNETPKANEKQKMTPKPEAKSKPDATPKPEASKPDVKPDKTPKAKVTPKPDEKPEVTPKPDVTPKQDVTPKPNVTPKPEKSQNQEDREAIEEPKPAKKSSACILI